MYTPDQDQTEEIIELDMPAPLEEGDHEMELTNVKSTPKGTVIEFTKPDIHGGGTFAFWPKLTGGFEKQHAKILADLGCEVDAKTRKVRINPRELIGRMYTVTLKTKGQYTNLVAVAAID